MVSRDFQVLGHRGDVQTLVPSLPLAVSKCKLPAGRTGSAIRLLIDGVERGHLLPDTVLDVPGSADRPPLRISVLPVPVGEAGRRVFAVLVEPAMVAVELEERVHKLEHQLQATEECLRTTIEEYEAATEELKCSYEELRSANEELQTTAEELHDSYSEVTAARGRLESLSRSLQAQNSRLLRHFEEFRGVLNSLGFPVILLGNDLRLRFFNRPAERLFHLTQADEGTLFHSLESSLDLHTLAETCGQVLDSLQPADRSLGNHSFQIRPLLTAENRIEGVILLVNRQSG